VSTVEEYLKSTTPSQQAEYKRIQKIVRSLVPDIEEIISYGIPTFKYKGKYVLYYGAFKDHVSIFPGGNVETLKDKLGKYKISKGTIQYDEKDPISEEIIKEFVMMRMETLTSKS
jgi:uncharacterized protein YdhG (YjbR/CyaY superfamily)